MANISEIIEHYLKGLLRESQRDCIEIQRNDLALKFNCAPSQINYVLTTRFSSSHGFVVESRRGGGGFIRIVRIPLGQGDENPVAAICNVIGEKISGEVVLNVLARLYEEELITRREAAIMRAVLSNNFLKVAPEWRDQLRAELFKAMLVAFLRDNIDRGR